MCLYSHLPFVSSCSIWLWRVLLQEISKFVSNLQSFGKCPEVTFHEPPLSFRPAYHRVLSIKRWIADQTLVHDDSLNDIFEWSFCFVCVDQWPPITLGAVARLRKHLGHIHTMFTKGTDLRGDVVGGSNCRIHHGSRASLWDSCKITHNIPSFPLLFSLSLSLSLSLYLPSICLLLRTRGRIRPATSSPFGLLIVATRFNFHVSITHLIRVRTDWYCSM